MPILDRLARAHFGIDDARITTAEFLEDFATDPRTGEFCYTIESDGTFHLAGSSWSSRATSDEIAAADRAINEALGHVAEKITHPLTAR